MKTPHASSAGGYILPLVALVVALLSLVLLTLARVQSDLSPALRLQASANAIGIPVIATPPMRSVSTRV